MITRRSVIPALMASCLFGPPVGAEQEQKNFIIELVGRKTSFDTGTGFVTIKGEARPGLVFAMKRKGGSLLRYWEAGAFRESVELDGEMLIDGKDISDMARISGFKMTGEGSYVYLRTAKGPKSRIELLQDGETVLDWPRGHLVRIIAFGKRKLILSEFDQAGNATHFFQYQRDITGRIQPERRLVGSLAECVAQSARPRHDGLLLQVYCDHQKGSDILFLDEKTGEIAPILATKRDEIFASRLLPTKGGLPVLQIEGNENGLHAFYATYGLFLSSLGEVMSLSSDEAGRQSWGQSYRLRTLGVLAEKTGHPVFAALAKRSIRQTLDQQNRYRDHSGPLNPSCGWASRIYSIDHQTPISLLVNQAMISASLIEACEMLDERCPGRMRRRVMENARCLVTAFEARFDEAHGLYRIPYAAPFRFDGHLAPWNWQLAWSPVLKAVGKEDGHLDLVHRADTIAQQFIDSWDQSETGALWRYWVPAHYEGWKGEDRVSLHRPEQKKQAPRRYEDISHAGISLTGLSSVARSLSDEKQTSLRHTLDRMLAHGISIPRDLDGKGPRSPRWLPGAGFDSYATRQMTGIYSRNLPGATSGDQLLAYARLIRKGEPVELKLTFLSCKDGACEALKSWRMTTLEEIMTRNPLFSIKAY